ncbi:MAG TPA: serine/threonine-protein kinase [Byssovorax sp.]|jgi:serine/threonine-protein kinase
MSAAGDATVRPGEVLAGKYRVLRAIGRGGMGVVVEATNEQLGERVAIKVLHDRYVQNREAMARFLGEAKVAVRVRGEHSVRLLDLGQTAAGAPFIVMELLEGMDLATRLKQGPLSIEDAALYILEACVGMAEVHECGIIHRDLKPGNLFLTYRRDATPLVKVLDFGIAKTAMLEGEGGQEAMTMTLVALGTPLYMSPEQVRASRSVDARSDVWSLGAILFEFVAGIPAFGGNSVANITAQILEATPPDLTLLRAGVPPRLDKIVKTALAKKPDQRYGTVAELAAALAPFAGEQGAALASRAARVLRGDARSLVTAGTVSGVTSMAPGATTMIEAATTHRFVRVRSRGVLAVALGALALVTLIAGWTAVRASPRAAVSRAAEKGVAERAIIAATVVRTTALLSRQTAPAASSAAPAPKSDAPFALDPSELPDVGAGKKSHDAPPPRPPARRAAPKQDDDPLGTRR